ncbi:hypothetical protein [Dyadobacter psychrotolerans]|uniref:Uncharacterized protein n=1 Tax=Dyadobacter psychrotolerans TaxID=2541721 RepID=A0A4R5DLS9_9BACT|nr:hypothetical protein [Dyadobacter psychrotolerans]TDE15212.1 hypothetical protein E0F88_11850 [Dyadobacter psychrotolerans]
MKHAGVFAILILFFLSVEAVCQPIQIKKEYASTLLELTNTLYDLQIDQPTHTDCGALACKNCNVLHTRAAESVYPFAVAYRISGQKRYLKAAKNAAFWLIRQQQADGSWKETPEEWTGTTTDQLLMLLLAYEVISDKLGTKEKNLWMNASGKAADYLYNVMKPEFASINYVATTTATLAKAYALTGVERYSKKARELAHRTISKMDDKGFINGEGGRGLGSKLGIDLGYEMEMSLWGLGLYARISGDTLVDNRVRQSLKEHLYFIYPDGSMDNSWGIRSNKWTMYGGATSDGCQALLSLYAGDDERYAAASYKNLLYLRKNILFGGLIGYGPHHAKVFESLPCIYPTFTKAKNLALAYQLEEKASRPNVKIPSEHTGWLRYFENLDVVQIRTKNFMATVTAYGYKDQMAGAKSKYMFRPSGGVVSYLWAEGYGALQASSVTEYSRPEPMSFPEAPGVKSLTPRISYADSSGYFTNLFEFDARLKTKQALAGSFSLEAKGELKNRNWINGGVAYSIDYTFADDFLEKKITLTYHDAFPVITITEPFILEAGAEMIRNNDSTVLINGTAKNFVFSTNPAAATLITGKDAQHYWAPYPALKAFPVELLVAPPSEGFQKTIVYRISVKN